MNIRNVLTMVVCSSALLFATEAVADGTSYSIVSHNLTRGGKLKISTDKSTKIYYRNSLLRNRRFGSSAKICFQSNKANSKVTLKIKEKGTKAPAKQITLKNNQCNYPKNIFLKDGMMHTVASSARIITENIIRLLSNARFSATIASTSIKGSSSDNDTKQVSAPFCLGNSNGSQYIQPKLYKQLFIPYFASKEKQIVNLIQVDSNNQTQIIQQTNIHNNRAVFSNIDIQPNFRYLIKFADNMGNATKKGFDDIELHPRDIDEERKNGSFSIPALNYNDEVTALENDLTYDVNILTKNTTHLFIYALNDINNQSISLDEEGKNSAFNFIESYINNYCGSADTDSN